MSVTAQVKYVHLVPLPHPMREWDGFFEAQHILVGDASGGQAEVTFYFGKPALEQNVILLDRIGVYSDVGVASNWYAAIRSWLASTVGFLETASSALQVLAAVDYPGAYFTPSMALCPQYLAYGLPIDQSDPYSVLIARSANPGAGKTLYVSIKGRWRRKLQHPLPADYVPGVP